MVDPKVIHEQLKRLGFGNSPWNQPEIHELPRIIHEGEQISECVNGFYEGGMALLVATEMRLLLVDKKPLRFLNVEDLRFDMINEIDYSNRLLGAAITISTGSKTLHFKSYNDQRLRHLIGLVQEHMSITKQRQSQAVETQQQHLEEMNKQLQTYLLAQQQQLQQLANGQAVLASSVQPVPLPPAAPATDANRIANGISTAELLADARREVFGRYRSAAAQVVNAASMAPGAAA